MNVLLVYGTTDGQTRNIARFVADRLIQKGNQVSTVDAAERALAPDPCAFDAVLVAASIHAGRYQSAVVDFVREHLAALSARPSAFLSVSLAAAGRDPQDLAGLKRCDDAFFRKTGWAPALTHHAAGAFRYTAYGFFKRCAMKYIANRKGAPTDTRRDYELTDWDGLARFADAFALAVMQRGTRRKSTTGQHCPPVPGYDAAAADGEGTHGTPDRSAVVAHRPQEQAPTR